MGHLINPISMRLGWISNWNDIYYAESLTYSSYYHLVFRIRLYLIYFFTIKKVEKLGLFYSHFEILRQNINLIVNVYIYHGKLESARQNFVYSLKRRIKLFGKGKLYKFYRFFILFLLFNASKSRKLKQKIFYLSRNNLRKWNRFIKFFSRFQSHGFFGKKRMNLITYKKLLIKIKEKNLYSNFLIFYFYFRSFKNFLVSKSTTSMYSILISSFIFYCCWLKWNSKLFLLFKSYLKLVLFSFTKFNHIDVNFFAISNDSVTAKFLSRFISRKLKQNYTLMELLNPIRRELVSSSYATRSLLSSYFANMNRYSTENKFNLSFKKGLFGLLISFSFSRFRSFISKFYYNKRSWLSYDLLDFLFKLDKNWSKNKCIGYSYTFYLRRFGLYFFFNYFFLDKSFTKLFGNYDLYYNKIYNFSNFSLNSLYFDTYSLLFNLNSFKSVNVFYNYIFYYKFFKYNYNWLLYWNKINKLHLRLMYKVPEKGLVGFKFHCTGRFTRKDRSFSLWFREGKVPLNTIEAFIDYGFYTIPLKNSAISIKIWLYKNKFLSNFYFKLA